MKKQWGEIRTIIILFVGWRIALGIIEYFSSRLIPSSPYFLGQNHWINFDGGHYISIADRGYGIYQQAFFPLYPIFIGFLSRLTGASSALSALIISHVSILTGIIIFYKLAVLEHVRSPFWTIIVLLIFPTSFFFVSGYSESLFFVLAIGMIYALKQNKLLTAGIVGMLASATRLFGVFLVVFPIVNYLTLPKQKRSLFTMLPVILVPLGFIFYMIYLQQSMGDPLAFFHLQPKFGAGRSGSGIIFLPQVLWRYAKILLFSFPFTLSYAVAIFEIVVFLLSMLALWVGWKKLRLHPSYLIYSMLVLIVPSLTGTLSSIPRYALSAFPLFFIAGNMHNKWMKIGIAVIFALGLILSTAFFLSGYFIA